MISIVIPAYNEENFLPACLGSLGNQDYKGEYEIIVVDNCSTDNTGDIAREFGTRVIHCPGKGVANARQTGACSALGDIIVQADADTIYPADWLTRIDAHFSSHPESVALAGVYGYNDPPSWSWLEFFIRRFGNRVVGMPFLGVPLFVSGANFAFRREAFYKTNGYDVRSLYPDQWGISNVLSKVGKISYQPTLKVLTSSRRIQKPFSRIAYETIRNLFGVISHLVKHSLNRLRGILRIPSGRPSFIRKPVGVVTATLTLSVIGLSLCGYILPSSQIFGKVYYQNKTPEKMVALTLDDGPNEPYTSQILDLLQQYDAKATFFVLGKNIELYPETAKRIVAEGHVLGNHTYKHSANHALIDDGGAEIRRAQEAIHTVTGIEPHLYRPPHGKKSPWELEYLKKQNLVEVTWSVQANEAHRGLVFGKPVPEEVANDILEQVKPGKIILMHDGYGMNHDDAKSDKSLTVKVLPMIIEKLQSEGYSFVTVPELLNIPAYNQ